MSSLNDVPALNRQFNLTDPKLVEYHPSLVKMMDIREHDQVFFKRIENYPDVLKAYAVMGPAYIAVHHGQPLAVFGCIPLWSGVGEAWLITDKNLSTIARPFHRVTKKMFDIFMSELQLVRLQVTVHSLNFQAIKWIKTLYFREEGRLQKYGPDGEDFFMYARIKDGRSVLKTQGTSTSTGAGPRVTPATGATGKKTGGSGKSHTGTNRIA